MTDYGYEARQEFIRSSETLDAKRAKLRSRMHEAGRYFIGEEILAKKHNGIVYNPRHGWKQK